MRTWVSNTYSPFLDETTYAEITKTIWAASIASAEIEFQANKLEDEFGAYTKGPYKF